MLSLYPVYVRKTIKYVCMHKKAIGIAGAINQSSDFVCVFRQFTGATEE